MAISSLLCTLCCGDECSNVTNNVLAVGFRSFSNVSLCIAVCLRYILLFWGGSVVFSSQSFEIA